MWGDSSGGKNAPSKKLKFTPKVPPRKIPNPVEVKSETRDDEDALNQELLKHFNIQEGPGRSGATVERKSAPMQVVFGHGPARTSELPRGPSGSGSNRSGTGHKGDSIADDDGHEIRDIVSTDDGNEICNIVSTADASESAPKMEKEYVEPWDYTSYYPTTLPLRRPYLGKPELLDEQEFGKASADFDETCINPAAELGLTDNKEGKMILFHLPHSLPLVNRAASRKGKEIIDTSKPPPTRNNTSDTACSMKDLPAGFIGKMLVYKSGAVKMKLGDIIFDVSPGTKYNFAQDVAAINVKEKHFCLLGDLDKRAVVTPDVDSLIDDTSNYANTAVQIKSSQEGGKIQSDYFDRICTNSSEFHCTIGIKVGDPCDGSYNPQM
ncbi:DNA-directed RNA polymerase III subunit RPC4 [Cinnamomum micranthum f. kanehirae]|uniref:DNA-directed RNA polymerase III subunit RPC4 n=1 Tax=Cinnamomum micranthum f. kanehirae TaxID=337451 RepID=A0A443PX66_9MAGN|nr:DNA-directed RNA polymerase III subunit RPC4 [Cinnamomum micranthum f. kanehirae]